MPLKEVLLRLKKINNLKINFTLSWGGGGAGGAGGAGPGGAGGGFDILTFLVVPLVKSLINREQKLDSKKIFWKNSRFSIIGLHYLIKK